MAVTAGENYLLMDKENNPLGRGERESPPDAANLQLFVLDGKIDDVIGHEVIKLLSLKGAPPMECKVLRCRGDRVILEPMQTVTTDMRRNLRVPVRFDTFLYPVNGGWTGRRTARSQDLSCGGIAFHAEWGLWDHEIVEVIVPTVEEPLILRGEILRQRDLEDDSVFYAARFVDMCEEEEMLVRETVFSIQLENRPSPANADNQGR